MKRKYKSRAKLDTAIMYFMLIVESLYFICFFADAKKNMILLWSDAGALVVFLDVILFELLAGIVVLLAW